MQDISEFMLRLLMDCHEREILRHPPCEAATTPHVKGLIVRGLLTTQRYITETGKNYVGVCLTSKGKQYLENV